MSDQYDAPADRTLSFLKRLHPVTRVIVAAGVLHLAGDVFAAINALWMRHNGYGDNVGSVVQMLTNGAHALAYSIGFFGTAATVEYLFRIWREVVVMRRRLEASDKS